MHFVSTLNIPFFVEIQSLMYMDFIIRFHITHFNFMIMLINLLKLQSSHFTRVNTFTQGR